jgi:hypothetical protein
MCLKFSSYKEAAIIAIIIISAQKQAATPANIHTQRTISRFISTLIIITIIIIANTAASFKT